jgi:hypothetical protein
MRAATGEMATKDNVCCNFWGQENDCVVLKLRKCGLIWDTAGVNRHWPAQIQRQKGVTLAQEDAISSGGGVRCYVQKTMEVDYKCECSNFGVHPIKYSLYM